MTGLRRIISILAVCAALSLGAGPGIAPLAVQPAEAQNRIGKFFNKVGDAIVNNPLSKRRKRNKQNKPNTGSGQAKDQAGDQASLQAGKDEPAFERETRRLIQSRLNALGHKVGIADGIFGQATRRGIANYQASLGTAATGYLTQGQADLLLTDAPEPDQRKSADPDRKDGNPAPATGKTAQAHAGPDAVWVSSAMQSCSREEMFACMERFGAPAAALAFARQSADAGLEPGLMAGFDDFGIVDLARVQYPQPGRQQALVLVNGRPALVPTGNNAVGELSRDDPVYRRLVSRYGELQLIEEPRLESHRLMTRGEQRFVFAYRLAKCQTCATPGEMLVAFDFDAAGRYKGLSRLGIASRDPDQDWLAANSYRADELQSDMGLLQRRLAGLGFEPGPLDGEGGKQTETALTEVQANHGLRQSGEADERTVRLLAQPEIIIEISRFEQIYRIATEPDIIEFALQYGLGVLNRATKQLNPHDSALARMNSRIARLHDRRKDYAQALAFAQNAVAVSSAAGHEKSQNHGLLLFNLGETFRNLDRKEEAVEQFDAAFDVFEPLAVAERKGSLNLAAQALERTGSKLIALYEEQGRSWSAKRVKKRLETVQAQLFAAD